MSCTCYRKCGLLDFIHPSRIPTGIVFDLCKTINGHLGSFVITDPKNLEFHYFRGNCYCPNIDISSTYENCFEKFIQSDEEFKSQIRELNGTLFICDEWVFDQFETHLESLVGWYRFEIRYHDTTTIGPCQGLLCSNPLECDQTGPMMHFLMINDDITLDEARQTSLDSFRISTDADVELESGDSDMDMYETDDSSYEVDNDTDSDSDDDIRYIDLEREE